EERETISSLLQAAAAGGFTRICILPDTSPPIDNPSVVAQLLHRGSGGQGGQGGQGGVGDKGDNENNSFPPSPCLLVSPSPQCLSQKLTIIQQDDMKDLGILEIRSQVFMFATMSILISVAQSPGSKITKAIQQVPVAPANDQQIPQLLLVATSGVLTLTVIGLIVYGKLQMKKLEKKIKFEKFRARELEKKFKLALETITKMETNPDLINSRDFNLDYLRMRMAEEVFHFAIVNQVKIKVKDQISQALRPNQAQQGVVGIANSSGRQVDHVFDVEYETNIEGVPAKRVLFRVQIRLMKLPTQATSASISQIIDCIETYLSPAEDQDTWQPTIQGRIAYMHWDQKAKPTPLLVLEQSNEGVNVTFRTSRQANSPSPDKLSGTKKSHS
ncbi:MAG: hypothetical protein ACR2LR_05855, partial [Hassallia sp.]